MLKITVAGVGKLKEKYWREAVQEYSKRLRAYCQLELREVPDQGYPDGLSALAREQVKAREWQRLSRCLRPGVYVVALDVGGEQVSSEQLAARLDQLALGGHSAITFLIGGSLGLPEEALRQAHWRLSCSRFTFPHQLMRVILLEQVYRAFKISRGEPYHK